MESILYSEIIQYKSQIVATINSIIPACKIFLFGSRATGTGTSRSDIDIALDNREAIMPSIIAEVNEALDALNIPYFIDIVDINNTTSVMKAEIERYGIVWK